MSCFTGNGTPKAPADAQQGAQQDPKRVQLQEYFKKSKDLRDKYQTHIDVRIGHKDNSIDRDNEKWKLEATRIEFKLDALLNIVGKQTGTRGDLEAMLDEDEKHWYDTIQANLEYCKKRGKEIDDRRQK